MLDREEFWKYDVEVGKLKNEVISIDNEYLHEFTKEFKKYESLLPDLEQLRSLHNSYLLIT